MSPAMVVGKGAPEAQVPEQEGREEKGKEKETVQSEASGENMSQAGTLYMAMS